VAIEQREWSDMHFHPKGVGDNGYVRDGINSMGQGLRRRQCERGILQIWLPGFCLLLHGRGQSGSVQSLRAVRGLMCVTS
jgi:hypothetical protein